MELRFFQRRLHFKDKSILCGRGVYVGVGGGGECASSTQKTSQPNSEPFKRKAVALSFKIYATIHMLILTAQERRPRGGSCTMFAVSAPNVSKASPLLAPVFSLVLNLKNFLIDWDDLFGDLCDKISLKMYN